MIQKSNALNMTASRDEAVAGVVAMETSSDHVKVVVINSDRIFFSS